MQCVFLCMTFNSILFGTYNAVCIVTIGLMCQLFTVSPEGSVVIRSDKELYEPMDSAILICTHLGGPGNMIQWLRNGALQDTEGVFRVDRLVVGEVITCRVVNTAGQGSDSLILRIAPVVTAHPTDVLATVNETATFCCGISSYPPAEYEWFKLNGSLPPTVDNTTQPCLNINISFGDEGEYYCIGSSNNISVTSNAALLTGELLLCFACIYMCVQ